MTNMIPRTPKHPFSPSARLRPGEELADTPGCLLAQAGRLDGWTVDGYRTIVTTTGRVRLMHTAFWFTRTTGITPPRTTDFDGDPPAVVITGGTYRYQRGKAVLWLTLQAREARHA
jgi:hypothetical protein